MVKTQCALVGFLRRNLMDSSRRMWLSVVIAAGPKRPLGMQTFVGTPWWALSEEKNEMKWIGCDADDILQSKGIFRNSNDPDIIKSTGPGWANEYRLILTSLILGARTGLSSSGFVLWSRFHKYLRTYFRTNYTASDASIYLSHPRLRYLATDNCHSC